MCAIIDANVAHEVFGSNLPPAGEEFFAWLNKGSGRLVVGGRLLEELETGSRDFRKWATEVALAGKMSIVNKSEVDAKTEQIRNEGSCTSDDPHVIALAQVSRARLLYSNDRNLQKDFGNKKLIDYPRGKVYSTHENKNFMPAHKRLLGRKDLCRAK